MGRVYSLWKSLEFNYSFLREKVVSNFMKDQTRMESHKNLTTNRQRYISKLLFIPLLIIISSLFILSHFPYIRCIVYTFGVISYASEEGLPDECPAFNEGIGSMRHLIHCSKKCVDYAILFVYMTFVFSAFKFPIRNDKFKVKVEVFGTIIVWILAGTVCNYITLFYPINFDYNLLINTFQAFSIGMIYTYVTVKRSKVTDHEFYMMLYNFDIFMKHPICFSYFKEYLKRNSDDDYAYLFFWIDYQLFKNSFHYNCKVKNIERANYIFMEYFLQNKSLLRIRSESTKNFSSLYFSKLIDFPVEIYEVIDESANVYFDIEDGMLYSIFDDAFAHIHNKLYNRYLGMFRDEVELKEVEKLICYIEFDIQ
jgi:hypothetical protein